MATPNRTYLSDGQVLESPPFSARVSRSIDSIYNFFGLYFVSLLSVSRPIRGRRELSIQYTQPTEFVSDASTMGLLKYAKRIRGGGKWSFQWGRAKTIDGDGGRRERAGMQQLRVTVVRAEGRDIKVMIGNEGSDDILVRDNLLDDVVIAADDFMEITITPHLHGPALLCRRRLQHSDPGLVGNASAWPAYVPPSNDSPPIELILRENPYYRQERIRYLTQDMNRAQLEEMIVLARIYQGICTFSTLGLTAEQLRESIIRDFYGSGSY